jgi:hypothetical protein
MQRRRAQGVILCLLSLLLHSFFPVVTSKFQKEEMLRISTDPHFNYSIVIGAPISFDRDDVHFTSASKMKHGWTMYTGRFANNDELKK